jgi:hypothetical protein
MTLGCVTAICKLVVTCYKLKHPARNLAEMINNGMKNLERERERERKGVLAYNSCGYSSISMWPCIYPVLRTTEQIHQLY